MERMLDLNFEFMIYAILSVWAKMKKNSKIDMERKCEKYYLIHKSLSFGK
jgi:hypothetical protein